MQEAASLFLFDRKAIINRFINFMVSTLLIPALLVENYAFYTNYGKLNIVVDEEVIVIDPISLKEDIDTIRLLNIQGTDYIDAENPFNDIQIENTITLNDLNIEANDMIGHSFTTYDTKINDIKDDKIEEVVIPEFEIEDIEDYTMYVDADLLNVRQYPFKDYGEVYKKIKRKTEVNVIGEVKDSDYVQIMYEDKEAFVHKDFLVDDLQKLKPRAIPVENWNGKALNTNGGVTQGPSGKETYYNLDMTRVVNNMRKLGYNYEYWIRDDGVKMYGDYVMVAANLQLRPRGSIVPTSQGMGIVCDTGGFASTNPTQLDLATTWTK